MLKAMMINTKHGKIAYATDESGEVLCHICYIVADRSFLITEYFVSPSATPDQKQLAGDLIDELLEEQADHYGVTNLLMVKPGKDECEVISTYTRKLPQLVMGETTQPSPIAYLN